MSDSLFVHPDMPWWHVEYRVGGVIDTDPPIEPVQWVRDDGILGPAFHAVVDWILPKSFTEELLALDRQHPGTFS